MTREKVIETLENLAMSQGSYGRLLKYLEEVQSVDPDKFEAIMSEMEKCSDAVSLVMMMEG